MSIIDSIIAARVVAIIRGVNPEELEKTAQALFDGGIRALEVTFNTAGAPEMVAFLKRQFDGKLLIGAGTVLDAETARTAILNGADFLLSPSLDGEMIKMCRRYQKAAIPGVMTPTEIVRALEYGADMVKVFPASVVGPVFFQQVRGPLADVRMMAVGGITADNFEEYCAAGACCVGVGGDLVNLPLIRTGNYQEILKRAQAFTSPA